METSPDRRRVRCSARAVARVGGALLAILVPGLLVSCASRDAEPRRIAFVQDLSAPDADEHVQPALQAAELAVAMHAGDGEVELVPVELADIEDVASDPSFVAAIPRNSTGMTDSPELVVKCGVR